MPSSSPRNLLGYDGTDRHKQSMLIQSKVFFVSLAHRYWHTLWSLEENRKAYGAFASAQGVGSNLRVTLHCRTLDPGELQWDLVADYLRSRLDHRCLFTDEETFLARPSTLENIVEWLGRELADFSPPGGAEWVTLEAFETESVGCLLCFADFSVRLQQKVGNLRLTFAHKVDSESGLLISRGAAPRAVAAVFPYFSRPFDDEREWLLQLFNQLQAHLPSLCELTVDLGRQKTLRIALP